MVQLSEIASIHGGGRLGLSGKDFMEGGTIPAYGAAGLNGFLQTAEYESTEAVILSSVGARCGKCFIVTGSWTSLANTQVIVPRGDMAHARFLWYQLNDERRWRRSGSAQPFIKPSDVKAHYVNLPSLDEQRRVVAILDHADAIRTKRHQVLAHLDTLTQSIFHEMFGDPDVATDEMPFGTVASLAGGRSLVAEDTGASSEYRVLKISAVTTGEFRPDESKALPLTYVPPPEHLVSCGDLLMSRANTTELVGAVAYVSACPPRVALPDKIWRFAWRIDSEPVFYHALLRTSAIRRRISRLASGTGGSMKNVAKTKLEAMPIPRVPIEQQRAFVARAERVRAYRGPAERALEADGELFRAIQARAFRGALRTETPPFE